MRPHPRIRKTIKWGGAAVTVLLMMVWIGSGWYELQWMSATDRVGNSFAIHAGRFEIGHQIMLPSGFGGWQLARYPAFKMSWWFTRHTWGPASMYFVPLWGVALPMMVISGAAWRLDTLARRRARLNLCLKCHYDRAGIAGDAKCPECGAGGSVAP